VRKSAAKVAISLEPKLLQRAEQHRLVTGESRSALVARALRDLLASEGEQADIARYVAAYRETPETLGDVQAARAVAKRTLRHLPWEGE
jgi:metal-responsive CopG/Arc/MetJ family transcriptional regulator